MISGTAGRGTVTGLQVEGADVSFGAGQVAVGNWGQLTLERKVGRARSILVLSLLAAHGSLPAGTDIAVGFEAAPQHVAKPKSTHMGAGGPTSPADRTGKASQSNGQATKKHQQQPQKPPPNYPAAASPLKAGGGLTDAALDNPVVAVAMQYLGVPYQWGGASPKTGFDCSGLVQYVFAQLGVPLVHYAAAQWHSPGGVWVAPNRLQPGDLVFFVGSDGTRKAPGHVGIYVGDGYIIDAPHTGTFVRIDSLNEPQLANQYVGARKILGASLGARHLLRVTGADASAAVFPGGLSPQMTLASFGEPLASVAADAATPRTGSRADWVWAGVVVGSVLLVLATGVVTYRRRRPASDAGLSTDTTH
jgi:cell wall-associated NlpC family hydrolase